MERRQFKWWRRQTKETEELPMVKFPQERRMKVDSVGRTEARQREVRNISKTRANLLDMDEEVQDGGLVGVLGNR